MPICKGCQAPLVFVETLKHKKIPLEPKWVDAVPASQGEPSFSLFAATGEILKRMRLRGPTDGPYARRGRIVHWGRCPKAEQFRKKGGTP